MVTAGVDAILAEFRRTGFITATATVSRTLHSDSGLADVAVVANKGRLIQFGNLEVSGMPQAETRSAQSLWKLRAGEPMNGLYVDDYLKEVFATVRPKQRSVSSSIRLNGDVADVVVTFR